MTTHRGRSSRRCNALSRCSGPNPSSDIRRRRDQNPRSGRSPRCARSKWSDRPNARKPCSPISRHDPNPCSVLNRRCARHPSTGQRSAPSRNNAPLLGPPTPETTVIAIEHDELAGVFYTEVEGNRACLDYRMAGKRMTITHIGVPPPIEGRGIAAQLMRAALAVARLKDWEVMPACSYAAAHVQRSKKAAAAARAKGVLNEALEESVAAAHSPPASQAD